MSSQYVWFLFLPFRLSGMLYVISSSQAAWHKGWRTARTWLLFFIVHHLHRSRLHRSIGFFYSHWGQQRKRTTNHTLRFLQEALTWKGIVLCLSKKESVVTQMYQPLFYPVGSSLKQERHNLTVSLFPFTGMGYNNGWWITYQFCKPHR